MTQSLTMESFAETHIGDPITNANALHQGKSSDTATLIRALYAAIATNDIQGVIDLATSDHILHVPGRSWTAGDHWGAAGLAFFLSSTAAFGSGTFELYVPVLSVSGEHAFAREIVRTRRKADPDEEVLLRVSRQFKVRDGKVSESWIIPEDQRAYDRFYGASCVQCDDPQSQPRSHPSNPVVQVGSAISSENEDLLHDLYRAFWQGDMETMRHSISEDVVVNITGRSALSGEYRGWHGYLAFRDKLIRMGGSKYKLDVVALAASTKDVWAREYIRMDRHWDPVVRDVSVIMHFEIAGGRIVRMNDFPVDPYAWERFFGVDAP